MGVPAQCEDSPFNMFLQVFSVLETGRSLDQGPHTEQEDGEEDHRPTS